MSNRNNPSSMNARRRLAFMPKAAMMFALATFLSCAAWWLTSGGQGQESTREVLQRIGVKKGICVIVGMSSSALPLELARASELLIYVQLNEEAKVQSLRRAAEAAGLLGKRVYVEKGDLQRLHVADSQPQLHCPQLGIMPKLFFDRS